MNRGPAVYQCLSCGFTWEQKPAQVKCPCGSKHVKWVNYEAWAWKGFREGDFDKRLWPPRFPQRRPQI